MLFFGRARDVMGLIRIHVAAPLIWHFEIEHLLSVGVVLMSLMLRSFLVYNSLVPHHIHFSLPLAGTALGTMWYLLTG